MKNLVFLHALLKFIPCNTAKSSYFGDTVEKNTSDDLHSYMGNSIDKIELYTPEGNRDEKIKNAFAYKIKALLKNYFITKLSLCSVVK